MANKITATPATTPTLREVLFDADGNLITHQLPVVFPSSSQFGVPPVFRVGLCTGYEMNVTTPIFSPLAICSLLASMWAVTGPELTDAREPMWRSTSDLLVVAGTLAEIVFDTLTPELRAAIPREVVVLGTYDTEEPEVPPVPELLGDGYVIDSKGGYVGKIVRIRYDDEGAGTDLYVFIRTVR